MYQIGFSDEEDSLFRPSYEKVRIYSNSRRRWYTFECEDYKECIIILHVKNLEGLTHVLVPNDRDKFNDLFYFILEHLEDAWSIDKPQNDQQLRLVYYYYNESGEIVQLSPDEDDNICQFFMDHGRKEMEVNIIISK